MRSRWTDAQARAFALQAGERPELGLRVYTSRLLGSEPSLVLHGGGNTSLKLPRPGTADDAAALLFVKGSGTDLAAVTESDFAVVRLEQVRRLIDVTDLDNDALAEAVAQAVERPGGPKPSIETLLHAVLPWRFVEHTHADSILAITNTVNGEAIARELFGELAPLVPFRHSGFALAQAAHETYERCATARTIGLILLHHGVFAFGHTARDSYENMLALVTRAEDYLAGRGAWALLEDDREFASPDPLHIARLRAALSRRAGYPLLLRRLDGAQWQAYARRDDVPALACEGPATPQHAVFIKREPMLGTDVEAYARRYEDYVAAAKPGRTAAECGLDPAPRVVIDARLGVWAVGVNEHYLGMTIDILRQDMEIKSRAAAHDRYQGLPPAAILEAEIHYGGFERRLHAGGVPAADFLGEVVMLALESGQRDILRTAFETHGATVIDGAPGAVAAEADDLMQQIALRYGGIDVVVTETPLHPWIEALLPLLACAPRGGRLVTTVQHAGEDEGAWKRRCEAAGVALIATLERAAPSSEETARRVVALCCPPPPTQPVATSPAAGAMH
jgi:rhamnose utilization protein RhaD (predicted bifunctional aldolase and dehydrogenase)